MQEMRMLDDMTWFEIFMSSYLSVMFILVFALRHMIAKWIIQMKEKKYK